MRIIDAQYFIPMAIMTSVFPTLVPIYERQKSIFFQHVWKLLLLFLAAGVGLSLFLWYTASWLLPLLFSAKYASSSEVLQILAFSLVFYFVYYFVSNVLFVMGKEKVFTLVMAISLVGAFLMNAILIPRYGFHVAAQVRCGSEAFIALGLVAALAFSRNQIIRARAVEHGT
jgi:PST family polysaccharide transporter